MNILQPEIVKIGNRHYRKNPFTLSFNDNNQNLAPYEEETEEMYNQPVSCKINPQDPYNDESCRMEVKDDDEEDYTNIELKNGVYKLTMNVSESYFGFIIGKNGEKKSNLERNTSTKIIIPKRGEGEWIRIEGKEKSYVASCRNRLNLLISSARLQKPFTHFLAFPLNFDLLKQKLHEFRKTVLETCSNDRGVDESIFQNPDRLHLTITTATLLGSYEIDEAVDLLQEFRNELSSIKPLKVNVRGLEYMNDDPGSVDVLYARIKQVSEENESNNLQKIADKLMKKFVDAGLAKKQYDKVKIHATVMNTLLRKDPNDSVINKNDKTDKQRESFDARNILNLFGDYDFGIYTIQEIHLSIRFNYDSNGFYQCCSKITL